MYAAAATDTHNVKKDCFNPVCLFVLLLQEELRGVKGGQGRRRRLREEAGAAAGADPGDGRTSDTGGHR